MKTFSLIKALVAGNPHDVASDARDSYPGYCSGVSEHNIAENGEMTSGTVEFMVDEHPTVIQQRWLDQHPKIKGHRLVEVNTWGQEID